MMIFIGKKDKNNNQHLLHYHSLDVAYVVSKLINNLNIPIIKEENRNSFNKFLILCGMLHDLGKFSNSFQEMISGNNQNYKVHHPVLGLVCWLQWKNISDEHDIRRILYKSKFLDSIKESFLCHHGTPAKRGDNNDAYHCLPKDKQLTYKNEFESNENDILQFLNECIKLLDIKEEDWLWLNLITNNQNECFKYCSWIFAGLYIKADWIGSNIDLFPYNNQQMSMSDYWKSLQNKFLPNTNSININYTINNYKDLFNIEKPTPLQLKILELSINKCKSNLFIIEDLTGAGKTEAAFMLAYRLIDKNRTGIYFGLPTQATSNAIYNRTEKIYDKFYINSKPSLNLTHGSKHLNQSFTNSIDGDDTKKSFCDSSYTKNKKLSLFADICIGTIDQILFSVLPIKHQSLKNYALYNKVIIIDEVHTYDSYMMELLCSLLRFLYEIGAQVILLSATLPSKIKDDYLNCFNQKGVSNYKDLEDKTTTPCIINVSNSQLTSYKVDSNNKKQTKIVEINSYRCVLQKIIDTKNKSQCVCWIRNTVADSIKAYKDLIEDDISESDIDIFHSKFAMIDKIDKENNVISKFGKESNQQTRCGKILITTQIVEQSLDVDFDVLISDICPITSLIQRDGRLRRHIRDDNGNSSEIEGRGEKILYVYCPIQNNVSNWILNINNDFKGTSYVYSDLSILYKTQKVLNKGFDFPDNLNELIEYVFDENNIVKELRDSHNKYNGKDIANKCSANINKLNFEKSYSAESNSHWSNDEDTSTRLIDGRKIILAKKEDDRYIPYSCGENAWDYSSISISNSDYSKINDLGLVYSLSDEEYKRYNIKDFLIVDFVCKDTNTKKNTCYDKLFGLNF
jgi:CRISPR-associated endonuclease/helicase Cas3